MLDIPSQEDTDDLRQVKVGVLLNQMTDNPDGAGLYARSTGTKRLVLTGQVTEQCILYTALDASVRHFPVVIPTDAVAHVDEDWARRRAR